MLSLTRGCQTIAGVKLHALHAGKHNQTWAISVRILTGILLVAVRLRRGQPVRAVSAAHGTCPREHRPLPSKRPRPSGPANLSGPEI
jgi:hypothetical protein